VYDHRLFVANRRFFGTVGHLRNPQPLGIFKVRDRKTEQLLTNQAVKIKDFFFKPKNPT